MTVVLTNLTDVETPALKRRCLLDVQIAIGEVLLAPGESVEVPSLKDVKSLVEAFVECGALHVGPKLPDFYVEARLQGEPDEDAPVSSDEVLG